jgi:hypothetical protein
MSIRAGLALGVICASLAVTGANGAAKKKAKAEPPFLQGCTVSVAPFCVGIEAGGRKYVLMGANPGVPVGIGVNVSGSIGGVTACLGTPVQVSSWTRNRMRCPAR